MMHSDIIYTSIFLSLKVAQKLDECLEKTEQSLRRFKLTVEMIYV